MSINKDTKIFASFSSNPGNLGCKRFNAFFKKHKIDAIYKSFYCNDIAESIIAAKTLRFAGCAISMPFKKKVMETIPAEYSEYSKIIGNANTLIFLNSEETLGFNTDWSAIYDYFANYNLLDRPIGILGKGAYSDSARYAFKRLQVEYYDIIERYDSVEKFKKEFTNRNHTIFNATPVILPDFYHKNTIINANTKTHSGKILSLFQAQKQLNLYNKYIFKLPYDLKLSNSEALSCSCK